MVQGLWKARKVKTTLLHEKTTPSALIFVPFCGNVNLYGIPDRGAGCEGVLGRYASGRTGSTEEKEVYL